MRKGAVAVFVIALMMLSSLSALSLEGDDAASDWHPAYDTLSEKEKMAFRDLERTVSGYGSSCSMETLTYVQAQKVYDAFVSDFPEYFWFENSYTLYYYPETGMASDITADVILDKDDLEAKKGQITQVVSGISVTGTSAADKLKAINDWLNINIYYDKTRENSGNIYGAFVEGLAKCDGYSYAANYLCKLNGIQSVCLVGMVLEDMERHAWNIMQLDDGKWYYNDITWNDPSCPGVAGYDYFLIGSETEVEGKKFSTARTIDETYGIEVSPARYDYDIPVEKYHTDWVNVSFELVSRYAEMSGTRYYTVNDLQVLFDKDSMREIKAAMETMSAEMWYVKIISKETSQTLEGIDPVDYEIYMYLDGRQVMPSDFGTDFGNLTIAPDKKPEGMYHAEFYTADGELLDKYEYSLTDCTSFTLIFAETSIPYMLILIVIVVIAIALMARAAIRRRNR